MSPPIPILIFLTATHTMIASSIRMELSEALLSIASSNASHIFLRELENVALAC